MLINELEIKIWKKSYNINNNKFTNPEQNRIESLPFVQDILTLMRALPPDLQEAMQGLGSSFEDGVRALLGPWPLP